MNFSKVLNGRLMLRHRATATEFLAKVKFFFVCCTLFIINSFPSVHAPILAPMLRLRFKVIFKPLTKAPADHKM